jgi:hypothetical protein
VKNRFQILPFKYTTCSATPGVGTPLAPATTVTTRFPSARVDKLRLGFTTPSWVEVDAVKVYGMLETRPGGAVQVQFSSIQFNLSLKAPGFNP